MEAEGVELEVGPGRGVRQLPRPKRYNKRRFLHFMNFHGLHWHGDRMHLKDCPKKPAGEEEMMLAAAGAADGGKEWWEDSWGPKTMFRDDQDDLKLAYAEALSNVDPDHLVVTWQFVHECELFCSPSLPNVNRWNKFTSGARVRASQRTSGGGSVADKRVAKADAWKFYKSARDYLATEHPVDSLLGTRYTSFTQESLVNLIMSKPANSENTQDDFGGFVVVAGGEEGDAQDTILKGQFGFCHQRCKVDPKDVGQFTKFQSVLQHGGDRKASTETLRRLAAIPGTMSKQSVHQDEAAECYSLDMFRFLVKERKFHSYRIKHFILFKNKHYLSPFLTSLLQRRWDLRKQKNPSALLSSTLKLLGNGKGMDSKRRRRSFSS